FNTLGCKLNYSETSSIGRTMQEQGFTIVDFNDYADVYVINTCSVTDNADKKCRNVVRRAMRNNEQAFVVVIGCYAQLKPKEISEIEGVDLVLGAKEKFNLPNVLTNLTKNACGQIRSSEIDAANEFVDAYSIGDRTRSFLKIQDGCDYSCSFCTIPLARGRSRSDTLENILKNAKAIAANGTKEIVLTGVNTGDYGKGINGNYEFFDVVKLLDGVTGIDRIRISSIEPNLLKNEIIEFVSQSKNFMPHFHIPLQSGSNKMLGLMRRRYRRELYQDRVTKIKSIMPHACIGVDVIVGFPGETDELFLETYNFLKELDVSYLHVFTYSERPNTRAIELEGIVPSQKRLERSKQLRSLSEKKKRHFYDQFIGSERKVLFEEEKKGERMFGFTDNYIKVELPYQEDLVNQITVARLNVVSSDNIVSGVQVKNSIQVES
ncbi:MAG: tRNA (N(6)-L-threonylcarbamoyladenosine(37)-C(2))-methylthiotransferase MtaB, partial [Gammaproteobacteria bacterium]|nr:tRNA (N(6)-L-threonylcarbamoyladenosine(37)-C(2))-methylthiotransferase MtaB [Gammaproteobacteria bacterium]